MYYWKQISARESSFIKGIAMLLILFHNYSHFILPWFGENEFDFSYMNLQTFMILVKEYPWDFLRLIFAFAGHYGVQPFIFLSGYGLFLSYRNKDIKWFRFFKKRFLKLYPTYLISICIFLVLVATKKSGSMDSTPVIFENVVLDLTFLQNFIPGRAFSLVGPWWFFSLIIQLYIVFPFLMKLFHRWGIRAIVITGIVSFAITYFLNPAFQNLDMNLYFLFLGRLPEFCLGIAFAWLGNFKISWSIVLLSVAALVLGNIYEIVWPFTMLAATLSLMIFINYIQKFTSRYKYFSTFITWFGTNSLFVFAVHGFLRGPFITRAELYASPLITILLGLAFLLTSIAVAMTVKVIEKQVQLRIVSRLLRYSPQ